MKKSLLIVILVIVVLAIIIIWLSSRPATAPTTETPEVLGEDTTSAINEALGGLDLRDLEAEFQEIDSDLNQL